MLVGENIGKHSFVHLSANKRLNRMNKSQILDFIAFYKTSQLFFWFGVVLCFAHTENYRENADLIQLAPTTFRQHLKTSGQLDLDFRLFDLPQMASFQTISHKASLGRSADVCHHAGAWTAWNRWEL